MNLIKIFNDIVNKLKSKKPNGFPVFAALILNNEIKFLYWNKKSNFKKEDFINRRHENHAEWIIDYQIIQKINPNYLLLITFPPCSKCFDKIKKSKIDKIIYLFDPWKKMEKNYLKNCDIQIEKIHNLLDHKLVKYNLKLVIKKFKLWTHFRTFKILINKYNKIENIKYS